MSHVDGDRWRDNDVDHKVPSMRQRSRFKFIIKFLSFTN